MYLIFWLCITPNPAAAELTAEQVVEKHIEAIGGREKWSAVKTMKVTGEYEGFSKTSNFTIWRKRPGMFRVEYRLLNFDITRAYDGNEAWWVNPMFRAPKPAPIPSPQANRTKRDAIFDNALIDWKEKGVKVKLEGLEKVEGEDHYKLTIDFGEDVPGETWFIHASTFLKTLVHGEGYEYNRPSPLQEFLTDYREVNGLMIPFQIEQEFHNRHRSFYADKIEINVEVDDALFKKGTGE